MFHKTSESVSPPIVFDRKGQALRIVSNEPSKSRLPGDKEPLVKQDVS